MRLCVLLLAALTSTAGCGSAEIVAPEPLVVIDSSPGQGASVAAGLTRLVLLFSEALDPVAVDRAVRLERVDGSDRTIQTLEVRFLSLDVDRAGATYEVDPLPAGQTFRWTVSRGLVAGASGALLERDSIRRFRTLP